MGMLIDKKTVVTSIFIDKQRIKEAFIELKKAILDNSNISSRISIKEVKNCKNFHELMVSMRWQPLYDKNKNIIGLSHVWDKVAEEDFLFKLIAPYTKEGSLVEYKRDGYISTLKVRYDFSKGSVYKTVWSIEYNDQASKDELVLNEDDSTWL